MGASDDPEYPDSLLTFGYSADNDSLLVTIDTASGVMTLKSDLAYLGTVELIVTVSDPRAASATDTVTVTVDSHVSVGDNTETNLPNRFSLEQNYPNPFNSSTLIQFDIPQYCQVELSIYNLLGQRVRTLVEGQRPAGSHRVIWDGRNNGGLPVATGIYLYRLQVDDQIKTKKMLLLK
ncbi:MAG: hypothetical protein DRP45_07750 [Candidatus Zixiibacteriota bacterium]|nr:MAG: hypothetical protein DRP45_07750 [candidate division Zixibacteria bacterium]